MKEEQKPENVDNTAKVSAEEKKDAEAQSTWYCSKCGYVWYTPYSAANCPRCSNFDIRWK